MVEHVGIEPTRPRSCKDQALTLSVPHRLPANDSNAHYEGQNLACLPITPAGNEFLAQSATPTAVEEHPYNDENNSEEDAPIDESEHTRNDEKGCKYEK